jgi:hypothetical protein
MHFWIGFSLGLMFQLKYSLTLRYEILWRISIIVWKNINKSFWGPSIIGVPHLKPKDSQSHLFLHFSHDVSCISPFFFVSNEIILFQILYRLLKFFFFTYESENSKIYPMWTMFYQWPKIPRNLIFLKKKHYNWAFGSCHIHTFYTH